MCGVKHAYVGRSAADRAADKLTTETDQAWRGYECPYCSLYHLTTLA